jgi:hypothetical protein
MKKLISCLVLIIAGCVPSSTQYTNDQLYAMWDSLPHTYPKPTVEFGETGYMGWQDNYNRELELYNNYRTCDGKKLTFHDYVKYMTGVN